MRLVTVPNDEIRERAFKLGFTKDGKWIISQDRTIGLILVYPFEEPALYLGTITFCYSKIKKDKEYSFLSKHILYRGEKIKKALRILKKRRVRVFFLQDKKKRLKILLLGTKEGTVAIAPIIPPPEWVEILDDKPLPIQTITKKPTTKMLRGSVFGEIFTEV